MVPGPDATSGINGGTLSRPHSQREATHPWLFHQELHAGGWPLVAGKPADRVKPEGIHSGTGLDVWHIKAWTDGIRDFAKNPGGARRQGDGEDLALRGFAGQADGPGFDLLSVGVRDRGTRRADSALGEAGDAGDGHLFDGDFRPGGVACLELDGELITAAITRFPILDLQSVLHALDGLAPGDWIHDGQLHASCRPPMAGQPAHGIEADVILARADVDARSGWTEVVADLAEYPGFVAVQVDLHDPGRFCDPRQRVGP